MNTTSFLIPDSQLFPLNQRRFYDGIEACFECASSCWISADAFLNEKASTGLHKSIQRCLSCAEICARAAKVFLSFAHGEIQGMKEALLECWEACRLCAEECRQYLGEYEHCLICSICCDQVCRICERYLRE